MKFFALVLLAALALNEASGGGEVRMIKDNELDTIGPESDKCTTMITGKSAGKHGPMTTHTADCADCDFRMNRMPGKCSLSASSVVLLCLVCLFMYAFL